MAAEGDKPERSERGGLVDDNKHARGAEKGGDDDGGDKGSASPLRGANRDTQSEVRDPSLEGRAMDVENFSLENIRFENKNETEHGTAERQAGATSPAGGGTAEGVRTGEAATGVRTPVGVAQKNSTAASGLQPQKVGLFHACVCVFLCSSWCIVLHLGPLPVVLVASPGLYDR